MPASIDSVPMMWATTAWTSQPSSGTAVDHSCRRSPASRSAELVPLLVQRGDHGLSIDVVGMFPLGRPSWACRSGS